MWTPEIKNGDWTGRALTGSDALIQWLEEALLDEGNAVYQVIGSASQAEVLDAVSQVVLSRMEYLLACYKANPGRFLDDQVFMGFSLVPTGENEAVITLRLLNGEEARMLWQSKGGQSQ